MARPASKYPTELELSILKVLWRQGPCTVRQVREALADTRQLAHTSVVTVMNIMVDKGYLARTREGAGYVYRPLVAEGKVSRGMLGDLVRRVYDGSVAAAMQGLLDSKELDAVELEQLRQLIDSKVKGDSK